MGARCACAAFQSVCVCMWLCVCVCACLCVCMHACVCVCCVVCMRAVMNQESTPADCCLTAGGCRVHSQPKECLLQRVAPHLVPIHVRPPTQARPPPPACLRTAPRCCSSWRARARRCPWSRRSSPRRRLPLLGCGRRQHRRAAAWRRRRWALSGRWAWSARHLKRWAAGAGGTGRRQHGGSAQGCWRHSMGAAPKGAGGTAWGQRPRVLAAAWGQRPRVLAAQAGGSMGAAPKGLLLKTEHPRVPNGTPDARRQCCCCNPGCRMHSQPHGS